MQIPLIIMTITKYFLAITSVLILVNCKQESKTDTAVMSFKSPTYNYEYVLKSFNPKDIGYGEETNGKMSHQSMACGLTAMAAAHMKDTRTAIKSGDCLLKTISKSKGIGWGLGWAWDAFNDGTINSKDTVYGITTAIAILGLLDAEELTGVSKYSDAALEALNYYSNFITHEKDQAFFWYSDSRNDAFNVHNVNSMMAYAFAKGGKRFNRQKFSNLAKHSMKAVKHGALEKNGGVSWKYSELEKSRYNDSVHAAYIVHGIRGVEKIVNTTYLNSDKLLKYLKGFYNNAGFVLEFRHDELPLKRKEKYARGWGLGMLSVAVGSDLGDLELGKNIYRTLASYEFKPHRFSYHYTDKQNIPRSNAHILLALAKMQNQTVK